MIGLRNVCFSYRKNGTPILQNVTLTAADGSCTVLVGENGSGKSTILGLLAGSLKPQSGEVIRDGAVGYVPQEAALFDDMTVLENLIFFAGIFGKKVPEDRSRIPFDVAQFLSKKVGSLSGGMKKRVSLACALLGEPQILLLDEPYSALDANYRGVLSDTIKTLRNEGCCIVFVGHREDEYCDFCDARYRICGGVAIPFPMGEKMPEDG